VNRTEISTPERYLQPKRPNAVIPALLLFEKGAELLRQQDLDVLDDENRKYFLDSKDQIDLQLPGLRCVAQARQSQINAEEMLRDGRTRNER
jgi:hypothetical protein